VRTLAATALVLLALAPAAAGERPTVVVTTSMLERAAEAVAGTSGVDIVRLVPPGSCPGHFDLSPSAMLALREASLLVRHDFQAGLESRLRALPGEPPAIVATTAHGSLLVPSHFAALGRDLATALGETGAAGSEDLAATTAALEQRLGDLAARLRARAAPLAGTPVVASAHQAEFCRWLGLDVVATLDRPEAISPRELGRTGAGAALVVANLQEGTQAAEALGERLGLPVAVFSNFPGAPGYGDTYEQLLVANLERLEAAWRKAQRDR
jgi:zinc transport system substrate-binding protein